MREAGPREAAIGLEVFYTDTAGTGGRLKRAPADFVVDEISRPPEPSEDGRFTIARVTSENWETNRLIRELSKALGIGRERIGFAGTKDKRAITSQLMSFAAPLEDVSSLSIHQVSVDGAYRAKRALEIGDLIGNKFKIKLSSPALEGDALLDSVNRAADALKSLGGYPNFFGVQRFGAVRPVTHEVGRWIVKGDLERAVMTYAGNPAEQEAEEAREARRRLEEDRDFEAAIGYYPKTLTFERMMIGFLARNPGDYHGAIQVMPPNLQMMFVHAYQSYLFNRMLSERVRRGLPLDGPVEGDVVLPVTRDGLPDHDHGVPATRANIDLVEKQVKRNKAYVGGMLFGSGSRFSEGEPGEIERRVIEAEGLSPDDFTVPKLRQCCSRGSWRELVAVVRDLDCRAGDDVEFSFSLNKGCYATSLLREFMKSPEIMDY